MTKQTSPLTQQDKPHIDHCLEQGLTREEAHYLTTTLIDHADVVQGSVFEPTATLQRLENGGDAMRPLGLHDFNILINNNSEKEYASWAEPPTDNS